MSDLADVENVYKTDPNLKRSDVENLQNWLKKQPHLPNVTELQILLFLHSCYYRVEDAKTAIDNFFTVRTLCSDIFDHLAEDDLKSTLSVGFFKILPKQTPDGNIVLVIKLIDSRPKNYDCVKLIKLLLMVIILHMHQYGPSNGVSVIFDMEGSSAGHLTRINLTALKQSLYLVQEGMPLRIKQIHMVNVIPLTDKLMAIAKPFLKNELIKLIKFHTHSIKSLYEFVPEECLPEDYGGQLSSIEKLQEENLNNLTSNMTFFLGLDGQRVDESKRVGKPKSINELFGIEGTFKKLDID